MLRFPRSLKLPVTVAIFDCGTNSVLLLIARLQTDGRVKTLYQAVASPRLGKGLAGKGKLNPKTIARTLLALKRLKKQSGRFKPGIFLALGTNVFRRAKDGRSVARYFEKELGISFIVLSAAEEARLEFSGATSALKTKPKVVVVDVGGGSSEVIWGRAGKIANKVSLEIGAVRLKEKFTSMITYNETELQKPRLEAAKKISKLKVKKGYRLAVLTGGTATTLAAYSLGLKKYKGEKVHGLKTTPEKLENHVERLSQLSLLQRKKALCFDPARADIIVPGGIILLEILKRLRIKKVGVSDHGLRWGAAYSYFS
jgi:exopolyphosphatase/guanosine-5'-triphosphate,3'-diphosphate pyrophosphatase